METQIVRTVTNLAQHAQIRNFIKLLFKKHRVSCHNLFLLGKRKPIRYLTLKEDHDISIYGLFYLGPVRPNMEINYNAPSNLCGFFDFGLMVKFQFCSDQSFTDNKTFSEKSHGALEG